MERGNRIELSALAWKAKVLPLYEPRINTLMKYYIPIHLENLDIIQKKVLQLFPKENLNKKILFYIPNNLELFFNIPELKNELDRLGWSDYIHSFAFYIVQKTKGSTHHTDTGDTIYSFNIPIYNCKNTFVNFYTTSVEPIKISPLNQASYYHYDPNDCELVDTLEMTSPHVINVKQVHNIVNNNNYPRITLLVRLKKELSLDHLFI